MNHGSNGNGNGTNGLFGHAEPELTQAQRSAPPSDFSEPKVAFLARNGFVMRGVPLQVSRHALVFELYSPVMVPQVSEVLKFFQIILPSETSYSGRAVVQNVIDAGIKTVCTVALDENAWCAFGSYSGSTSGENIRAEFQRLLQNWQKLYRVNRDYKEAIADLHSFMTDLQLWLNEVELQIRGLPPADQARAEMDAAHSLRDSVLASLTGLFERFESAADAIDDEFRPAHRAFGQRHLHPFMLSSPFLRRTYLKPLGYAGDYQMMNMIVRNEMEGETLFGKFANAFLLAQAAPQAVRNRVNYFTKKIIDETGRVVRLGRTASISSIACGSAWEVMNFLGEHPLANHSQFQLLDFEEETLKYTAAKAAEVLQKSGCRAKVKTVKNAVQNLLRARGKTAGDESKFDLIYCSGLYDYLNHQVCRALNDYLYGLLRPGGLLVVGNFSAGTRNQNVMEHFAEWFLIYRSSAELAALAPEQADRDNCTVRVEPTGSNIFLEVRKP
jgi:extracellular factor (EF) 3-hydroxypalmitic acid methyl ester biosynthesis protein